MSYAKPLKLIQTPNRIKTTGENYERFSSHNLAAKGLLADLRGSKLSKVMKHSRKKKQEEESSWNKMGKTLVSIGSIQSNFSTIQLVFFFVGLKKWKHKCSGIGE